MKVRMNRPKPKVVTYRSLQIGDAFVFPTYEKSPENLRIKLDRTTYFAPDEHEILYLSNEDATVCFVPTTLIIEEE